MANKTNFESVVFTYVDDPTLNDFATEAVSVESFRLQKSRINKKH